MLNYKQVEHLCFEDVPTSRLLKAQCGVEWSLYPLVVCWENYRGGWAHGIRSLCHAAQILPRNVSLSIEDIQSVLKIAHLDVIGQARGHIKMEKLKQAKHYRDGTGVVILTNPPF